MKPNGNTRFLFWSNLYCWFYSINSFKKTIRGPTLKFSNIVYLNEDYKSTTDKKIKCFESGELKKAGQKFLILLNK